MIRHYIKHGIDRFIKGAHWYNEVLFRDCRKFWDLKDEQFDIINLGSSSGVYDFCYDNCGIKGANWAVAPQSTLGDFIFLKQYRKNIKDGGVVIYPLCPFTAISGAVPYLEERCYSFIDYKSFPGGHYITACKVQAAKEHPLSIYPIVEFKNDIMWCFHRNNSIVSSAKELNENAIAVIDGWKDQFNIPNLNERFIDRFDDVYRATINMVSEIIDYCQSEGLELVFVFPPVYQSLAKLIPPIAREQLLDTFILQANKGRVPYYNFIEEPCFSNDSTIFTNSYYLNKSGAKKFTKFIIDKIRF